MSFRAVFFDMGGVIVRTEHQAPREHLAERLGLEYEDLVRAVFDSETARRATLGEISEEEHWQALAHRFHRPAGEIEALRDEFFGGDIIDHELLEFIRSLRPRYKTGLISNAWDGLRRYMVTNKFVDAFDHVTISAEVGAAKPQPRIFELALHALDVEAGQAIFVDDFEENIDAARRMGMAAVHFRDPAKTMAKLETLLNHQP